MDVNTLMVLMILGVLMVGGVIVGFFVLIALAAFTYFWTHAYPWLKMVGKFVAKPPNLFSLLILLALFIVAFIGGLIAVFAQLTASPGLLTYFLLLLVLWLIPLLLILYFLVGLGLVVWIVRLIKWFFARWRGWIEGIYFSARLSLIRLKIKADTMQETRVRGKPGTVVGGQPAMGFKKGKKGMGFKEKLEAIKSEFSGDVQRTRNKTRSRLSRRK